MSFFSAKNNLFVKNDVHSVEKNNKFLILSANRKFIFELKDVDFLIWKNLQKPISSEELFIRIKKEYDVDEIVLKKDLNDWLKNALKEKIIKKVKV